MPATSVAGEILQASSGGVEGLSKAIDSQRRTALGNIGICGGTGLHKPCDGETLIMLFRNGRLTRPMWTALSAQFRTEWLALKQKQAESEGHGGRAESY